MGEVLVRADQHPSTPLMHGMDVSFSRVTRMELALFRAVLSTVKANLVLTEIKVKSRMTLDDQLHRQQCSTNVLWIETIFDELCDAVFQVKSQIPSMLHYSFDQIKIVHSIFSKKPMPQKKLLRTVFACIPTADHVRGIQAVLSGSLDILGWSIAKIAQMWRTMGAFRAMLGEPTFINVLLPELLRLTEEQPALMQQIVKKDSGLCRVVDDPQFLQVLSDRADKTPCLIRALLSCNFGYGVMDDRDLFSKLPIRFQKTSGQERQALLVNLRQDKTCEDVCRCCVEDVVLTLGDSGYRPRKSLTVRRSKNDIPDVGAPRPTVQKHTVQKKRSGNTSD